MTEFLKNSAYMLCPSYTLSLRREFAKQTQHSKPKACGSFLRKHLPELYDDAAGRHYSIKGFVEHR
jgi:hypothetical protein